MRAMTIPARRDPARHVKLLMSLFAVRSSVDLALKILPILAKRGLALPAAYLVWWTIQPLTRNAAARHRVLVIEKAVFNQDAIEVLASAPSVTAFGIKRAVLKSLALGVLPKSICDDATYVSTDPAAEVAKLRYRELWRGIWRHLHRLGRYDAVLSGNWCYWAEREMAAAMEEQGSPFLVLHKEGIKPPARSEMLRDLFRATRGRFTGRRVFVYHELERDHQLKGDIARDDQIRIVGMPRLDRVHAWRRRAAAGEVASRTEKPTVLFLAFLPNNFLPSYSGIVSDLAWTTLCRESYDAACRLARKRPDIDVIIRPRSYEIPDVKALLAHEGPPPMNLRIVAEGDVAALIEACWVICGHNTTVMLEGLAAGKPVVEPRFAEACDPRYKGYIVDLGDAVEYAVSAEDLVARLTAHCATPPPIAAELSAPAYAALAKWTGNADGRAGERTRAALLAELEGAAR